MEGRNADCLRTFHEYCVVKEISKMDQRDQELLGKQLRQLNPSPRSDGVMILAFLAVFFTGMALGGFLFAYNSEPLQIASNDATTATSVPNGAPPTTLR
jgi:hypothetical protein